MNLPQFISSRLAFVLVLFMSVGFSGYTTAEELTVKLKNNRIAFRFADEIRLGKGTPFFEGRGTKYDAIEKEGNMFLFSTAEEPVIVEARYGKHSNVVSLLLSPNGNHSEKGDKFLGILFESIPGYEQGLAIGLIEGGNEWARPFKVPVPAQMQDSGVQLFYWRYEDGFYGAMIPLCGQGYRDLPILVEKLKEGVDQKEAVA